MKSTQRIPRLTPTSSRQNVGVRRAGRILSLGVLLVVSTPGSGAEAAPVPVAGDWGGDGIDTVGTFDPALGEWRLRTSNSSDALSGSFRFGEGIAGAVPVAGDWDGDGDDTVGLYNPVTGRFFLRNSNSAGQPDLLFRFFVGVEGVLPVAGDWNADGLDTVGLYGFQWFLRDANSPGLPDVIVDIFVSGTPLTGDWNGDGVDTIGGYGGGFWVLRDSNSAPTQGPFLFPRRAQFAPVVGDWDGDGVDTPGVRALSSPSWQLRNTNSEGPADVTFDFDPLASPAVTSE